MTLRRVSALFVDPNGVYAGLPGVDLWPIQRDARTYIGDDPVVAHPPCQRWGKFATGGTHPSAKRQTIGDDGGCFRAALGAVRICGGVLEHPKDSKAWAAYGIRSPPPEGGWVRADAYGGYTCCVWQGHYGHFAGKATWLYAANVTLPDLKWGKAEANIPAWMVERYGERKARKIGLVAMVGGKDKTRTREATPPAFAELLLSIARTAWPLKIPDGHDP